MPTYSFVCPTCLNEETAFGVNISDRDNKRTCTQCGNTLKRKINFRGAVYAPTASNGGTLR